MNQVRKLKKLFSEFINFRDREKFLKIRNPFNHHQINTKKTQQNNKKMISDSIKGTEDIGGKEKESYLKERNSKEEK